MNTKINNKRKQHSHYIIFSFLLITSFAFHIFFRNDLQQISNQALTYISHYFNQNTKLHSFLIKIFLYSQKYDIFVFALLIIMYNFANIFKTYILILTLQITYILLSITKLIYRDDKPFLKLNKEYENIFLLHNKDIQYGTPSNNICIITVFLLTYWRVIFKSVKCEERSCCYKFITLIFVSSAIIGNCFINWIFYSNSLDQISFSICLALCIYFFIFYVLNLYSNDTKQLFKTLIFPIYYKCLIYLGIIAIYTVFFFTMRNWYRESEVKRYYDRYKQINIDVNEIDLFNREYFSFCIFFFNIGMIFGMRREYFSLFEGNFNNWAQYNFEKDEEIKDEDDQSLMSKLSINKAIQWNHTKFHYSIARLILLLLLLSLCGLPYLLISPQSNIILVIVFKYFLPLNIVSFGMFYGYKQILKFLKVTNILIFTMLRESV